MLENIPCVPYQQAVSTVFLGKFFSINLYKEGKQFEFMDKVGGRRRPIPENSFV